MVSGRDRMASFRVGESGVETEGGDLQKLQVSCELRQDLGTVSFGAI
jgi:hypothetical protein